MANKNTEKKDSSNSKSRPGKGITIKRHNRSDPKRKNIKGTGPRSKK